MNKEITLSLNQQTYERVLFLCGGNEDKVNEYAIKAIENSLALENGQGIQGLEDYLKSGSSGSRAYGINGQGW